MKKNTISIKANLLYIEEKQKITSHWLKFLFVVLGIQAILYWNKFFQSQENYHLFIAIFISLVVTVFFIREAFFRTNKNIIELKEIRKVSIQKVALEIEKVYLNIKLKRKTRVVLIDKRQADEIKNSIVTATEVLLATMYKNNT